MQTNHSALLLALLCSLRAVAENGPELRLPLEDYETLKEDLRKAQAPAKGVAAVETLRLSGSFAKEDLVLTLTGQTVGKIEPFLVLTGALHLRNCAGSGHLTLNQTGYLLTPTAQRFSVTCKLSGEGNDDLAFGTTGAVPNARSSLP